MGVCANCKFWDRSENGIGWEAGGIGFHSCKAVRERWRILDEASEDLEYSHSGESAYMKSRKAALKAAKAYVQDGSEYRAELVTGPDFGCTLFEVSTDIPAPQTKKPATP